MRIDIVTLFPTQINDFLHYSIIKRAMDQKHVEIGIHDLRKWAVDKRGSVDDKPYGGGLGMILRVEPVVSAIREIKEAFNKLNTEHRTQNTEENIQCSEFGVQSSQLVIMFDARGEKYTQQKAFEFSKLEHLILIAGHYEGFDERIKNYVDVCISVGDYVLTGGEIPALIVTDSIVRLLPGVLKEGVVENESFSHEQKKLNTEHRTQNTEENNQSLSLEYPQYTRPEEFEGHKVPEILLSGDHEKIEEWRCKLINPD